MSYFYGKVQVVVDDTV